MDDLLQEFLTETNEGLAVLDVELVELEQRPNDKNLLSSIFRIVHTVKGTCGFIGLPRLEKVAHAAENVLGMFRDGKLDVTPDAVTLILNSIDQIKYLLAEIEMNHAEPAGDDSALIERLDKWAAGDFTTGKSAPAAEITMEFAAVDTAPVVQAAQDVHQALTPVDGNRNVAENKSSIADQSIRVNVDVLESLMNTVSELVLTRNQLLQLMRAHQGTSFVTPLQRLNLVTSELQESVMKTRMQPIGNAWQKLPRIVRDLAQELGKKIDLVMIGQETELDRQVLELIKDPLTHMVRNSADHGLELPADRAAAGKPEMGKVMLSAFHEGGYIIIQIADDGKGLPVELIKKKAVANGLATEAELATMTDQQIYQFIFKAGFSTAAAVTSVSGRGVGMDVVRTNIEKIGGKIELASKVGKGSTFTIKIPLTLAIVNALIVECGGEKFAIPQIAVTELVRTKPNSELQVEYLNEAPVLRLRNRLLPLISLRKMLKLGDDLDESTSFVIVTHIGNSTFGLLVDKVFDTEEIVVKPVSASIRNIGLFAGNTIMGDGSVILILDPNGIANRAGDMLSSENYQTVADDTANTRTSQDKMPMLLFRAAGGAPKAIPLSLIARLEELDLRDAEISNNQLMIQYRDKLMPLLTLDGSDPELKGQRPILVMTDRDRQMGLIVDEIIDIVEERLTVEVSSEARGVLGSAIVAGRATDVIDAGYYITRAYKDWFHAETDGPLDEDFAPRILLVDDSMFFRNLLSPLLSVAGYNVTTATGPAEAMQLATNGKQFDLIVSDIEMPDISGFEFAEMVRAGPAWADVPMVALSSHATLKDIERGAKAGFTDYIAKFDRDALLQTINRVLRHGYKTQLSQGLEEKA